MGKQIDLYKRWKSAKHQLAKIFSESQDTVIVHYSCESFYDRGSNPRSPRITSIAVRNLATAQTKSFSIHMVAERKHLLDAIEEHLDELEEDMLRDFFEVSRDFQASWWVHWNMRDANYGFEALENRYKVFGGTPFKVPDDRKIDLSRLLIAIYGVAYIGHPRLEKLLQKNHITVRDFLNGQQEADAFENKEFVRLHQSTLRKVDILANLAERANRGELETNASWWEVQGKSLKAAIEWPREHWLIGGLLALSGIAYAVFRLWTIFRAFFTQHGS